MATDITALLSTEKRKKTLDYVLLNHSTIKNYSVRMVARELKLNGSFVSRFFSKLIKIRIMSEKFEVKTKNPLTRALKILLNTEKVQKSNIVETAKKVFGKNFLGIGLYGSWANGTNTQLSDMDLWIKLRKYESMEKTVEFLSLLKKKISVEVNLEVLYPERIEELKAKDKVFYHALLFSSIVLEGDGLES